jgi:copper chaperone CopZ
MSMNDKTGASRPGAAVADGPAVIPAAVGTCCGGSDSSRVWPCARGGSGGRSHTPGTVRRVTVPIFGLGCGGSGAEAVERALEKTRGVVHAYVNPATEMAYVEFDCCACGTESLNEAVRSAGLRAGPPVFR